MRVRTIAPALVMAGLIAQPSLVSAQVDPVDPVVAERDAGGEWGWIGLLGLIGLMGLRRRDRITADRSDVTASRRPT